VHADEQAAALVVPTGPVVDEGRESAPAAEIEIADAEIAPVGNADGVAQGGEEIALNIVENLRHQSPSEGTAGVLRREPIKTLCGGYYQA
jgi:hypothetical protein